MNHETIAELKKPLEKIHVREREQSGRKLSYIEGWHAISEANRIFGFDAWTRETIDIRCVSEHQRRIGRAPNQRDGWGVSYIARVRVVVEGIVREGIGAGHGIDVDLGLAHESAIKEAETDAMKRALMTFGNPFGLALYDKTQANVVSEPDPKSSAQLKREDVYAKVRDDLANEMLDVHTFGQFEEVKGAYRERARAEQWNAAFLSQLKELFAQHEEELQKRIDADNDPTVNAVLNTFPGARVANQHISTIEVG